MTNKEKAEKIYLSISPDYKYGAYAGAMKMAEWKDQQYADIIKEECNTSYESGLAEGERKAEARFKGYLEKKRTEPKKVKDLYTNFDELHHKIDVAKINLIDEIIDELFKED